MSKTRLFGALVFITIVVSGVQFWRSRRPTLPDSPSLVILPAKISGPSELGYLSDAVSTNLTALLSDTPGIETKLPPTSIEFERVQGESKKVAQAYDVNLIVATDIVADSDRLKLDVQMIEPVTQRVLWSDGFDGTRGGYIDMIHRAAESLRLVVQPSSTPLRDSGADSEAELTYREGEHYVELFNHGYDLAHFDSGLRALQRALDLNPTLANAAADIARLYAMRIEATEPGPALIGEVEKWANRALEIDPRCGRAFYMLSAVDGWRFSDDPLKRLPNALRAAAFAPEYAPAHFDLGAVMAASANLGLAASRRSRQIDPLFLYAPLAEVGHLQRLGRTTEAFSILDRYVVSIDSQMIDGRWAEVALMIELGWLEKAEIVARGIEKVLSGQRMAPLATSTLGRKYSVAQKQFGSGGLQVSRILDVVNNPNATTLEMAVAAEMVPMLANSGYLDDALLVLNRASEKGVVLPYDWLRADRRLDRLRKDREFAVILERSRRHFDSMVRMLEDARSRNELPQYLEHPLAELRNQLQ